MRKAPFAWVYTGALLLVLILTTVLNQSAQASHGGADAFSLDMDVAGNTATNLGPNDTCVSTIAGNTVTVDLTVTNVPPFNDGGTPGVTVDDTGGIIGWTASILYSDNGAPLRIEAEDQSLLLASNAGSALLSASDTVPDNAADNQWTSSALDTGVGSTPEESSGVLARLTVSVDAAAATGNYNLQIDSSNAGHTAASGGSPFIPHSFNLGTIAVGQACAGSATPSPSPSPTAAPTAAPTVAPTASPVPTAVRTPTPAAPAAFPPTGGEAKGGSGPVIPLFLGALVLLIAALCYGSNELRQRPRSRS